MREFLEIDDPAGFIKVARESSVIIRIDPFLLANMYGLMFFIDMGKISEDEVREVFQNLREKMVFVKNAEKSDSISSFLKERQR